jgi:hypothetical protein
LLEGRIHLGQPVGQTLGGEEPLGALDGIAQVIADLFQGQGLEFSH